MDQPFLCATPAEEHSEKLTYLRLLLDHLPGSVPFHDMNLTIYNFSVNKEDIVDLGDENSAVNCMLEISFGDCSKTHGVVPIKERGPGVNAIVDVLQRCLARDLSGL